MKKLLVGALVGLLGLASVAAADRGDRHYPRGGGDRYDRQRYEASVRYERGSRNYDRTYVRYGQDSHYRRHDLGYDRYDRRDYYTPRRGSGWGFSFGYRSGWGYAGDSVSLGLSYSNRPSVTRYYSRYSYYPAPQYYERRVRVYEDYCPPTVYEYREYRAPAGYYSYSRGSSFSFSTRGYYRR